MKMEKILNYHLTKHSKNQMNSRRICSFLISLCLAKGKANKKKRNKIEYHLSKEKILTAIELDYISINDCQYMKHLVVVTKNRALITVYARYGDTGI